MKYTIYLSSLWSQMTMRGLHNHRDEVWKLLILRQNLKCKKQTKVMMGPEQYHCRLL